VSGRGNVTRRGRNSWRIKFDLGTDPVTGKRLTRFVTVRGTKATAQRELTKLLSSADTGQYVDQDRQTTTQFAEHWLATWAARNTSNKTFERYEALIKVHVLPRIGSIPIQKLRAADLQKLYAGLTVADRTRLHIHRIIHRMLKHAAQWSVVQQNVAALLDAPSVKSKEIEILAAAEIARVLETLKGRSLYPIVVTALGTGMRRGELLALRWKDVDLDGAKLRVEQSLEQTKRGGLVFKAPKTRHGRRTITLPSSTVAVLREHFKATLERRLVLRQGKIPDDALVFATWDGATRSQNAMSKEWRRAVHAAKLKATFHSLRHTHASSLIAAGIDVLSISRRLGHGSPAITLGVYGHCSSPTIAPQRRSMRSSAADWSDRSCKHFANGRAVVRATWVMRLYRRAGSIC
jgi:integrase